MRVAGGECGACGRSAPAVKWTPCGCVRCESCAWGAIRGAEGNLSCPTGCAGADGATSGGPMYGERADEEARRRKVVSLKAYDELPETMCDARAKEGGKGGKAAFRAKSKAELAMHSLGNNKLDR